MTGRRWVYLVLVVSLVINGLLIGGWLGHSWRGEERSAVHALSRHILRHEPEELSEPVQAMMREKRGEMRAAFRELKRARRHLAGVIEQDPVDRSELEAAFSRLRLADVKLKTLSHEILVAVLAELPKEQRAELLRRSAKGHHRDGKHPGKYGGGRPGDGGRCEGHNSEEKGSA